MRRNLLILGVLLLVLGVAASGCNIGLPDTSVPEQTDGSSIILSQQNTGIWVTGEGKMNVVPDVAIIRLGVESQAMIVAEAQRQAQEAMAAGVPYGIEI